ncbi:MAG: hypothetical protein FJ096_01780 [Deltaproteobacteria bacterium]|nr:hypothetical protein [Deltaproteobacteria bacterium]
MLERVSLNQTRLRTPGLSLDPNGVALGARALVLLPTLDRLTAFLALYTAEGSLAELSGLAIELHETRLKTREVVVGFAASNTGCVDRAASVARLAGGMTFTGTQRVFVQYRDAASPLGYDLGELPRADGTLHLVHSNFEQTYDVVRKLDLAGLLMKLDLLASSTADDGRERWIVCEAGLGPALIHYLARSEVQADVGVVEWPPASALETQPLRRHLFRVRALPARMLPLLTRTPGIRVHALAAPGCAVEIGYRHPIQLRACPVFSAEGLVLLGGRGAPALRIERLPAMGPVAAFARVTLRDGEPLFAARAEVAHSLELSVRLEPSVAAPTRLHATLVQDLALLRQIAYELAPRTLGEAQVAFTDAGAFVRLDRGIESLPIGEFFEQIHPSLYVSAGHALRPEVDGARVLAALDVGDCLVFLHHDGRRLAVARDAFVPLADALLGAQSWTGLGSESIARALEQPLPTLRLDPLDLRPMRDVSEEPDDA